MTVDRMDLKVQFYNISNHLEQADFIPSDAVDIYDIVMYASQIQPDRASKLTIDH